MTVAETLTKVSNHADEARGFVAALMPSLVVAMSATKLASFLSSDGVAKVEAAQRAAVINGMMGEGPKLSYQGQDKLRRAANRIATDRPDHMAWTSMSTTRGAIGLGLWQTALEIAVNQGGKAVCSKASSAACEHKDRDFKDLWTHFIGVVRRLDAAVADPLADVYSSASERILLRHRLLHGKTTRDDGTLLRDTPLEVLVAPLATLRQKVVEATLSLAFEETDPSRIASRLMFEELELPTELLDEVL